MIAVAGKGQTDSHFIHVAALSSAGSGFPMRNNWVREQLNTAQEVLVLPICVGTLDAENFKLSVLKGTDPQENTIFDLRP